MAPHRSRPLLLVCLGLLFASSLVTAWGPFGGSKDASPVEDAAMPAPAVPPSAAPDSVFSVGEEDVPDPAPAHSTDAPLTPTAPSTARPAMPSVIYGNM